MWWANWLALRRAGARPVRLTPDWPHGLDRFDGFLIGGGDDISAELYGGELTLDIRIDPDRDRLEQDVLAHALTSGRPVLGVCRGAQMINVHQGGSLHTDIHAVYETAPRMRTILPRKRVTLAPDTRLRDLLGVDRLRVNALHHQAVDRLGEGLVVTARDDHGIVQAIECAAGPWLLGVQWHPEFLQWTPRQQKLFDALVAAAG